MTKTYDQSAKLFISYQFWLFCSTYSQLKQTTVIQWRVSRCPRRRRRVRRDRFLVRTERSSGQPASEHGPATRAHSLWTHRFSHLSPLVHALLNGSLRFQDAVHRIHRSRQWNNTDSISKHRLSPYNAHYLNYNGTNGKTTTLARSLAKGNNNKSSAVAEMAVQCCVC